jgi:uncharacterized protein YcsI (UPF0317 family)
VQANLVVIPEPHASDFLAFCRRNPAPCPVLDVLHPGEYEPRSLAPGADIRTDLPAYRLYRGGELEAELTNLLDVWRDDLVAFLLGCSFTFDDALQKTGIPVRHLECGTNVPMYVTTIPCQSAGVFSGPLVVSMRPIPSHMIARAEGITANLPLAHGGPVHCGDPAEIGIDSLDDPDFGDAVSIHQGEEPVFWACGTTPQAIAMSAKLELMITHAPGHMLVTDLMYKDLDGRVSRPWL